eukprot:CAMPEP_0171192308 /NCGR_PEP_ID=MMETSP0790-20130122/19805_1 /TAXON_ID=2925 /ORGANISM="Alexandrium catenella, Strain OF101" /LENGTH=138 /DNA_ID=CAMNT_0011657467 /DNA_START=62 /DNA_END=475 /DNA_ORIENTATION=-
MASKRVACALLVTGLLGLGLGGAFTVGSQTGAILERRPSSHSLGRVSMASAPEPEVEQTTPFASSWARIASGLVLGALLLFSSAPARADLEDTPIPLDDKGKTVIMSKEEIIRGKRLFNAACASCHVGGGTRTNQNVG